ncbi:hypothetical protein LINPERHAP1_LOCUS29530 [Linum perenne]
MDSRKGRSFRAFESPIAWNVKITLAQPPDSVIKLRTRRTEKTSPPIDRTYVFRSPLLYRLRS